MQFKDKLKQLRKELKLTQKDLSKKINSSQSKIGMWETGQRDPNSDDIILLANFFNVSTDYLLGISNERNPKEEDLGIVTKAFHLAEDVDELPQEALDQIDEYIRLLKLKHKK